MGTSTSRNVMWELVDVLITSLSSLLTCPMTPLFSAQVYFHFVMQSLLFYLSNDYIVSPTLWSWQHNSVHTHVLTSYMLMCQLMLISTVYPQGTLVPAALEHRKSVTTTVTSQSVLVFSRCTGLFPSPWNCICPGLTWLLGRGRHCHLSHAVANATSSGPLCTGCVLWMKAHVFTVQRSGAGPSLCIWTCALKRHCVVWFVVLIKLVLHWNYHLYIYRYVLTIFNCLFNKMRKFTMNF